jgi:hypothetical protein
MYWGHVTPSGATVDDPDRPISAGVMAVPITNEWVVVSEDEEHAANPPIDTITSTASTPAFRRDPVPT